MTTNKHSAMSFYRERKLSWRNGHFFYYFHGHLSIFCFAFWSPTIFSLLTINPGNTIHSYWAFLIAISHILNRS